MLDKFTSKQFLSTKIQQNIHFPHLFAGSDSQYIGTISPQLNNQARTLQSKNQKNRQLNFGQLENEICDLQDLWNTIQQKKQVLKPKKVQIGSIFDAPETLTLQQMEQIFGEQKSKPQSNTQAMKIKEKNEEAQDLGDLWEMVTSSNQRQASQTDLNQLQELEQKEFHQNHQQRKLEQQKCLVDPQDKKEVFQNKGEQQRPKIQKLQFYQVQEKEIESEGRVCLTLGKEFAIYDYANFFISCFNTSVYCYFGFKKAENEQYCFYDLTTNQPLMACTLQKYEEFIQNNGEHRKIQYQRSYCLKIRIANSEEVIATIWQKQISNGLLYNIRHYNSYEHKHDESVALIEITDSYIGNNCYCNTNVFISQKYCTQSGQLKMKLSLKNGYLIANMGVNGIKSAPYNCRLENPNNSFVYLLGLLDKEEEKFIVRVGQGISPVIAFATSIGRKRYIDSFKD